MATRTKRCWNSLDSSDKAVSGPRHPKTRRDLFLWLNSPFTIRSHYFDWCTGHSQVFANRVCLTDIGVKTNKISKCQLETYMLLNLQINEHAQAWSSSSMLNGIVIRAIPLFLSAEMGWNIISLLQPVRATSITSFWSMIRRRPVPDTGG